MSINYSYYKTIMHVILVHIKMLIEFFVVCICGIMILCDIFYIKKYFFVCVCVCVKSHIINFYL